MTPEPRRNVPGCLVGLVALAISAAVLVGFVVLVVVVVGRLA